MRVFFCPRINSSLKGVVLVWNEILYQLFGLNCFHRFLCKKQKPSPTFTYSWDPWDERYIYLHEWLIFMVFHVRYKYTILPWMLLIMRYSTFMSCLSPPSRDLPIHHSEFGWGDLASVDWQLEGGRDMGGPFLMALKKMRWLGVFVITPFKPKTKFWAHFADIPGIWKKHPKFFPSRKDGFRDVTTAKMCLESDRAGWTNWIKFPIF